MGRVDDQFVVVDKESVIGYDCDISRKQVMAAINEKYRKIATKVKSEVTGFKLPHDFGGEGRSFGNECDFIALTNDGELILMELKDKDDTQKIYLSPFQIGTYCDIFSKHDESSNGDFRQAILNMAKQKQELGLLNPAWPIPDKITHISAALVVGGGFTKASEDRYRVISNYIPYYINTYISNTEGGGEIEPYII